MAVVGGGGDGDTKQRLSKSKSSCQCLIKYLVMHNIKSQNLSPFLSFALEIRRSNAATNLALPPLLLLPPLVLLSLMMPPLLIPSTILVVGAFKNDDSS